MTLGLNMGHFLTQGPSRIFNQTHATTSQSCQDTGYHDTIEAVPVYYYLNVLCEQHGTSYTGFAGTPTDTAHYVACYSSVANLSIAELGYAWTYTVRHACYICFPAHQEICFALCAHDDHLS